MTIKEFGENNFALGRGGASGPLEEATLKFQMAKVTYCCKNLFQTTILLKKCRAVIIKEDTRYGSKIANKNVQCL